MKAGFSHLAVGAVLVVTAIALPALADSDPGDPTQQHIERKRKTLEKLRGEIEEKKKFAEEAEKKKRSVLQSIQQLDERLLLRRQERQEISRKLKEKDRALEAINAKRGAVRARIIDRRSSILARLRAQYIEGRFGYLKALLAAESYSDFLRRFHYLSMVSEREYDLLDGYRRDLGHLDLVERQREEARNEMLMFKQNTEKKLEEIQALKREKKLYLTSIIKEGASYSRAMAELEQSAARLDSLLKSLEARRRAAATRPLSLPKGAPIAKGVLQWPADGEVVSFFGRQKHPTFETYVQRKGIAIRTPEGSSIRAVMAGTVVYADWLKGYGLVVILDHGNGFLSLYAHASTLLVKVGDQVRSSQVIGETGDTGMTGESMLYFELRQGAKPVDPLIYLAKRP